MVPDAGRHESRMWCLCYIWLLQMASLMRFFTGSMFFCHLEGRLSVKGDILIWFFLLFLRLAVLVILVLWTGGLRVSSRSGQEFEGEQNKK